ncbi:MAG TPA: PAS domain-containing sensor histidine kinase [Polyangia bacterium]|nr:PAS domain-containing sensor histidine kinase [Polyangia bacterium]
MLADLLEELSPELIREVRERSALVPHANRSPDDLVSAMLAVLTASLGKGHLDASPLGRVPGLSADVESFRTTARLLEDAVYEALEKREAIPLREARILGAWAAALSERALRVENRRFAAMLDALPDQLFIQDAEGRYVYLNRTTAEVVSAISGKSGKDLIGFNINDLDLGDEIHGYLRGLHARVLRGELITEEFEFRLPAMAGKAWREHHVAPLFDEEGRVEVVAIASRDIQARKTAEAEAKRAQAELAQAVTFREQVMATLSHDLRNPLSSVLSLAEQLKRKEVPDRVREGLTHIERAAQRMNEMIGTLLDATQLRFRGGPQLHRSAVALDMITRGVIEELRAVHPGRDIEFSTSGDVSGRWDPGRIAQVVSNLIGNAIEHGPSGAPVRVRLARHESEVLLDVNNRGPTIPPEHIEHLFDAFWQPPGDGLTRRGGLGLGLFIVREIVRAHGGAVDVRSTDGSTTFTVRLPPGAGA